MPQQSLQVGGFLVQSCGMGHGPLMLGIGLDIWRGVKGCEGGSLHVLKAV